jgi:hypothetical protein
MLFREIIAVYCENHTEHINTLKKFPYPVKRKRSGHKHGALNLKTAGVTRTWQVRGMA